MKIYATRVWGFNPKQWPIISFARKGDRDDLLKKVNHGDLIILVATGTEKVEEDEKKRILGMAEIGSEEINNVESFLSEINNGDLSKDNYNDSGEFKWPYAIPMLRAWRFLDKPLIIDVLNTQLPYNATTQAVLLRDEDKTKILSLKKEEVEIASTKLTEKLKERSKALSKGIAPSDWNSSVSREMGKKSFTYAMQFGKANCWKIGWSSNLAERERQLNEHIPSELNSDWCWTLRYKQSWLNEIDAYKMEQKIFALLSDKKRIKERVLCTEEEVRSAFQKAIS